MAADLGLVVHAAQRDARELAAQRARDRRPSEVLPTPGGPTKHRIGPFMSGFSSSTRQVVEDAVLDLLQVVVVLVQNLLGLVDVDLRAGALRPRQHRQPLNVVARERIVGRHRGHARQPRQFLQRFLLHLFRHAGVFDLLAQLFDLALALVLLAEFLLDGLHLLAQIVIALRLLHLVLHFVLDLGAQLLHLELFRQVLVELLQARRERPGSPAIPVCRRWSGTARTKPRSPPGGLGSSILAAIVRSSSESVGDSDTICWNCPTTFRTSASTLEVVSGSTSSTVSISAIMKGSV